MWRSVEQTASHSKRQRVCTGSVFSRGCHHQLICKTCHRFTHGTATGNPAEECVSQISARLPKCLKTVFSPFSQKNISVEKGDYVSFHPPRFSLVSYQPFPSAMMVGVMSLFSNGFHWLTVHLFGATWPCLEWTGFVVFVLIARRNVSKNKERSHNWFLCRYLWKSWIKKWSIFLSFLRCLQIDVYSDMDVTNATRSFMQSKLLTWKEKPCHFLSKHAVVVNLACFCPWRVFLPNYISIFFSFSLY